MTSPNTKQLPHSHNIMRVRKEKANKGQSKRQLHKQLSARMSKRHKATLDKELDLSHNADKTIARMDDVALSHYLTQRVQHLAPTISDIELQDHQIPGIPSRPDR